MLKLKHTRKNESDIDDNDLYHVDNMSLDDNRENTERRKHVFESKLENKYDIEIQIGMTCIHGNKVNKLVEWNLLHDIPNPPKTTKKLNSHYYPILHRCKNISKGRANFKNFRILLDSGCSSTILMVRLIKNLPLNKTPRYSGTHKRVN